MPSLSFLKRGPPPSSTLFPYTTLFRSPRTGIAAFSTPRSGTFASLPVQRTFRCAARSEEHTSELQSHVNVVCRLLLVEKQLGCVNAKSDFAQSPSMLVSRTAAVSEADD